MKKSISIFMAVALLLLAALPRHRGSAGIMKTPDGCRGVAFLHKTGVHHLCTSTKMGM